MDKRIIALQGKGNTGKTTTLLQLISVIECKGYKIYVKKPHRTEKVVVADINGITVGITTRGDNKECLKTDFAVLGKCDLYVCACRSSGETVDFLNGEAGNGTVTYHGKWYVNSSSGGKEENADREAANERQASMLFDKIIEITK